MDEDEQMSAERGWYPWSLPTSADVAENRGTLLVYGAVLPHERGDGESASCRFRVLLLLLDDLMVLEP